MKRKYNNIFMKNKIGTISKLFTPSPEKKNDCKISIVITPQKSNFQLLIDWFNFVVTGNRREKYLSHKY